MCVGITLAVTNSSLLAWYVAAASHGCWEWQWQCVADNFISHKQGQYHLAWGDGGCVLPKLGDRFSVIMEHGQRGAVPVLEVPAGVASEIGAAARRIAGRHAGVAAIDDHELLLDCEVELRCLGPVLISELVSFRHGGSAHGALLLRGLPVDEATPATPSDGAHRGPWSELAVSTIGQLMIMSALGGVIAYADEKEGRLVQDICPLPGSERRQENSGSCLLELHTEDGFHPNMPHFISLMGIRPDHDRQAKTVVGGVRAILPQLSARQERVLREPLYRIRLSSSFVGDDRQVWSRAMPVLSGVEHDPDLCVDFHAMEAMTPEAAEVFAELRGIFESSLAEIVMERGDMVIIDNRKAVHGRTTFTPRYDGEDRWLRRCFTVTDIRATRPLLYPGSRVHRPLTEELLAA